MNHKSSKQLITLFLFAIVFYIFIMPIHGIKTKKLNSIKGQSLTSQKAINDIKKIFPNGLPINKSNSIKDVLPIVDEKEVEFFPTLTEKIHSEKPDKNLWITLGCQLILILSLLYILHLILYNRKIPISYEPHIQCKYYLKK